MKKLYEMTITIEAIVLAEDEDEAAELVDDVVKDFDFPDMSVRPWTRKSGYPAGWTTKCLPYGDTDGKTIETYLAEIEAEEEALVPDPRQLHLFEQAEERK